MTPLRKNLDRAKAGYGGIRYRGDLARDVLGAMAVSAPVAHLWRRRALAIAAAVALSATTFFAGSYLGRASSAHEEVALTTPPVKTSDPTIVTTPEFATPEVATADTTETFTLVPSLASADDTQMAASSAVASAQQSSMDFSMSVPSAPMLFSLATLADQETQTESTNGASNGTQNSESETRS